MKLDPEALEALARGNRIAATSGYHRGQSGEPKLERGHKAITRGEIERSLPETIKRLKLESKRLREIGMDAFAEDVDQQVIWHGQLHALLKRAPRREDGAPTSPDRT